ncbi:histone-lysine N-methyltransferase SETD2-like [Paramacrobiotus metropolitanus]|uniref:histone-lysine N-methyltransferase SETD2-like n=1 Tax=Paramacrobiotus metropolitanus TaxID=2943436 RepID=UPI002445C831|nr:histone-lysine N-methyltransferase SETD2-like [Paramacrobiotus metropolitanus]
MSGDQQQEPAGYFTHYNSSTGQEVEISRLRINGCVPVITTTAYVNGGTEPGSGGGGPNGPNSTGTTVSETKKMGKFKFLTIKDVNEGNSENVNSDPNEPHSQRSSSNERSSASPPRKPSFSSFINLPPPPPPVMRHSPAPENSFGIPGPLLLDSGGQPAPPRRLTEEDYIQKRVEDLLKMTSSTEVEEAPVEDEEEDDDEFEQRLEQIMAEDVMIRKKGGRGRKKGSRGPVARKRASSVRKGSVKKEEVPVVVVVAPPPPPAVEVNGQMGVVEAPAAPVPKKRGRKPKAKSVTTSSTDSPVSSVATVAGRSTTTTTTEVGVTPASEDTVSHTSEVESRDADEPGDAHGPRKLKSRWAELVCADPVATQVRVELLSAADTRTPPASAKTAKAQDYAAPGETPPPYEFISDCIRLSRHEFREDREARKMRCECVYTEEDRQAGARGCLEHCLNRMLYIECGPKCPAKDHCANKRFQRREYVKLKVFKTEMKGWGIRTETKLAANQFICEYVGEILDERQFKKRQKEYHKENIQHHYFMALNNEEVIDATKKGNFTRFTNHSCDPNSETQKWTVNGQLRIGFFTLRAVSAGEEITFDYQFERYGKKAQRCYCGSPLCRGFIGSVGEEKRKMAKGEISDRKMVSEIDRFVQAGSIRNSEQALKLARLLLRVEEDTDRAILLRVIQNSEKNPDALKAFLRCQGLTILADAMYSCRHSPADVKQEILQTLSILPIVTKNGLIDSKIWETLERWAGRDVSVPKDPAAASMVQALSKELPAREAPPPPPETPATPVVKSEKEPVLVQQRPSVIVDNVDKGKENVEAGKVAVKEEENDEEEAVPATVRPGSKSSPEEDEMVKKAAGQLLDKWETLKMLYKIPKKILTPEEQAAASAAEAAKKQPPPPLRPPPVNGSTIPTLSGWGRVRQRSPSPPAFTAANKRPKFFPNNLTPFRRFDAPYERDPRAAFMERRFPFPVPADIERRRQFMGHAAAMLPFGGLPFLEAAAAWADGRGMMVEPPPVVVDAAALARAKAEEEAKKVALQQQIGMDLSMRLQNALVPSKQAVNLCLSDQSVHDIRQFKPTPEQAEAIVSSLPAVGSESWQEKAGEIAACMQMELVPQEAPPLKLVTGWTANFDLTQMTHLPKDWAPAYDRIGRLYFYNTITGVSRWEFPVENLTYSSSLHQIHTLTLPADLRDFTFLPEAAVDLNAWTRSIEAAERAAAAAGPAPLAPPPPLTASLPPDLLGTRRHARATAKKRKIDFQNDVCQFILLVLNHYRAPQCTQGRIESKEDFKFLARKFTHNVVEQEMQRHKYNPEALQFSAKHKPKIKEHIRKYMARFGRSYRREGAVHGVVADAVG